MAFGKGMTPFGAGKAAAWGKAAPAAGMAPAGACSTMYGPVANVCQSAVPFTGYVPTSGFIPTTTVTPVPSGVAPQVAHGQPVTTAVGAPVTAPAAAPAWGAAGTWGAAGAPGVGAMTAFQSPWGSGKAGMMGAVPGIYTQEVAMPRWW